jgi:hypothetical protein
LLAWLFLSLVQVIEEFELAIAVHVPQTVSSVVLHWLATYLPELQVEHLLHLSLLRK